MKEAETHCRFCNCVISGGGLLRVWCVLTTERIADQVPRPLATMCSKQFMAKIYWEGLKVAAGAALRKPVKGPMHIVTNVSQTYLQEIRSNIS